MTTCWGDLQQLSLQVWWAKVKKFGLLHVLKRVELWFVLSFGLNYKFKPKIELVAIGLQNSASSSSGLSLKIVERKKTTSLRRFCSAILGTCKEGLKILSPWPTKLASLSLSSSCVWQGHDRHMEARSAYYNQPYQFSIITERCGQTYKNLRCLLCPSECKPRFHG